MNISTLRRASFVAVACWAVSSAWAAAPETLETELPAADMNAVTPVIVYELETEMVVKDWVLCISAAVAEQLAQAREESVEKALSAYAALRQARSCGRVPELRVILQERIYVSAAESGHDTRAYGALVNFSDDWASAYVVYGGLPAQ
jgi:hypothetical protein